MLSTPVRSVLATTLAAALAAAALAGCGQSDGGETSDRAAEPTASDTSTVEPGEGTTPGPGDSASATGGEGATSTGAGTVLPTGDAATTTTARIITASNADGETSPRPVPLTDSASVRDFVATMGADLGPRVRAAVRQTDVPPGQTLMGAIVSVGCDEPTGVEVVQTFDGYEVTAVLPKSGVQCVVAMTSVALFQVESP
ncbi:hypothetical protein [Nocardioides sediminis]|uniref:hypothetical protein n=1 Tax=Nocardioides sediminis TaxID=433648 RepID=UPI00131F1558|nr:hypothetical protein [Nocardioides sediminis]